MNLEPQTRTTMNVYVTEQLQYTWCWRLVKASISSLRSSGSFLLTASRFPSSRRATLLLTSWLALVSDPTRPAIPGIPLALVPMLARTTPRHICQRSKPTEGGLKTDREGVLPETRRRFTTVACHFPLSCGGGATTYRSRPSGPAVLS